MAFAKRRSSRIALVLCALAFVTIAVATPAGRVQIHRIARAVGFEHPPKALRVNDAMRPLALRTLDDKPVTLTGHERSVVVYNIFTTWCGSCREEAAEVARASTELARKGIITIGIDQGESPQAIASYAQTFGASYPMVIDDDRATNAAFGISFIPTTVVVRDGVVRAIVSGPLRARELIAMAERS